MEFEFDLVQGMVDHDVQSTELGSLKSGLDTLLTGDINDNYDNFLKDELSCWPVDAAVDLEQMPDVDLFPQPTYPSPEHQSADEMDSGYGAVSPGVMLPSPGPSFDFSNSLGSPCSQASSVGSDNLMEGLQQSVADFPDLFSSEFALEGGDDNFLQDLVGSPAETQTAAAVDGAEAENHTLDSDENDNEIEQILAAAAIKVEQRKPGLPEKVNELDILASCPPRRVLRSEAKPKNVKPSKTVSVLRTVDVSSIAASNGIVRGGPVARTIKIVRPCVVAASPSPSPVFETAGERNNKNAIQARLNRQKKKVYIEGLEKQVGDLGKENGKLKTDSQKLRRERDSLQQELAYLKSVLANQSMLSGLLQNIGHMEDVRLTSSFVNGRKRSVSTNLDHDYGKPSKKVKVENVAVGGGVCLHVEKDSVSLEFCSSCSKMSKGASRDDV